MAQPQTRTNEKTSQTFPPVGKTESIQYNVSTPNEYESNGETKTFWTNIGRAFQNEKGIMVHLNALPVNGKMFLQVPKERDA